jgi:hypothetical protein
VKIAHSCNSKPPLTSAPAGAPKTSQQEWLREGVSTIRGADDFALCDAQAPLILLTASNPHPRVSCESAPIPQHPLPTILPAASCPSTSVVDTARVPLKLHAFCQLCWLPNGGAGLARRTLWEAPNVIAKAGRAAHRAPGATFDTWRLAISRNELACNGETRLSRRRSLSAQQRVRPGSAAQTDTRGAGSVLPRFLNRTYTVRPNSARAPLRRCDAPPRGRLPRADARGPNHWRHGRKRYGVGYCLYVLLGRLTFGSNRRVNDNSMDDDLSSVRPGRTGLENYGAVRDEHRHSSTNSEGGGVRRCTVFVDDPGVGPERKNGCVPTWSAREGGVIDDEQGRHGTAG